MSARTTALAALIACRKQGAWADGVLKEYIARDRLDRRDAALASRLCYGVLQNRMLLDYYIEQFAHETSKRYDITVVTSDGLEQVIIRGAGCALISSREFEEEVKRVQDTFRQEYLEKASEESGKTYLGEFIKSEEFLKK